MKQFLIFKSQEKKSDKSPDYDLRANIDGKFVSIGGGWNRRTKQNTPFISCLLNKPYQNRSGWQLQEEKGFEPPTTYPDKFTSPEEEAVEDMFNAM